ncbi:TonB dependent receptor [Salegentibacter holothuriorum]|uniref:TonB dependent receptor n=1 Tax=Salegentibacter holothuriorum TaxID=241145 RepID=A0A1T5CTY0_9FLAO|nr:TonB-dependent receptor [Salegentibacter holothuriorum]SKB62640.1 TonB dependent receptor [Salegentibacter holothuriorum]
MQMFSIKKSLFLSIFLIGGVLFAQDPIDSETVTVVKPYTPTVKDANKIKQTPSQSDSVRTKKRPVKYSIFSVPVASTFTPAKGRATTLERERRVKIYDNYASLGFGNYGNLLAEFYSNLEVNRSDNFGVYLSHNSSQGGIDDVILDDKFYDTELNLSYNSKNRDLGWKTEIGAQHQLFNWYGLPQNENFSNDELNAIDPSQNYFSVYAGGEIELYDSFFDNARAKFRHTGDSYSTSENHLDAQGTFEVNIADELITTNIYADIVQGQMGEQYLAPENYDYTFMNFGINPSLLILREDLTLNLGVAFFYSQDVENSDGNFYIYPKVTASYRLAGDYFTPYAGLEGGLQQNTYFKFVQQNPYVSPSLQIKPTDNEYNAYVGAKGKLSNAVSYNFKTGYESQFNRAMFKRNAQANDLMNENYAYGNSFEVVYDDLKTLSVAGELNVDVNQNFRLGINAEYFNYNTTNEAEAWNLPDFKASLNADYQISENWFAGANLFYVGERLDQERVVAITTGTPALNKVRLDSYFDVNANLGYRFNDRLSIFAKGSNLLNNDYQRWTNFRVQGLQLLAGATYKFDF